MYDQPGPAYISDFIQHMTESAGESKYVVGN